MTLQAIGTLLRDVVLALAGLIGAFEFHEDVDLTTVAVSIPHGLGRRPWGRILVRRSNGRVEVDSYEQWTKAVIVMSVGAGTSRVSFVLF